MKKFMSAILAVIMMFSVAVPAFAAEASKNVDATFDNFTPGPGKKAPDNWYDPYCYEADGRINKYCLNVGEKAKYGSSVAVYCPEYKKIFTIYDLGRVADETKSYGFRCFAPYDIYCTDFPMLCYDSASEQYIVQNVGFTQWYCPYCGKYDLEPYETQEQYEANSARFTHAQISSVYYGWQCDKCDRFNAYNNLAGDFSKQNPLSFIEDNNNKLGCGHQVKLNNIKLYRFLAEEQRNSDYSFIFKETEKDFGNGKDGKLEDLVKNNSGVYVKWNSPDNPNYKPEEQKPQEKTFWDKLVAFFKSFGEFFAKIGTWIKNLFKKFKKSIDTTKSYDFGRSSFLFLIYHDKSAGEG